MNRIPHGLSEKYWNSLSPKHQALYLRIRPQPKSCYSVDVHLSQVEKFLEDIKTDMEDVGGKLELNPDFQRGHVWNQTQQQRYIESLLRGSAPKTILFNCPSWRSTPSEGDLPAYHFQCVDGLQRLTAVREFLAGKFKIFEDVGLEELEGSPFNLRSFTLQIAVYEFVYRNDLLQFYLDLNRGGTVHSADELARVQELQKHVSRPA